MPGQDVAGRARPSLAHGESRAAPHRPDPGQDGHGRRVSEPHRAGGDARGADHRGRQDHRAALIHDPRAAAWLVWLESSAVAVAMRQWLWLYPAVEVLHIAGIAALVGGAVMFDLRLLGVSRGLPVAALAAHLLPWARVGLGMVALSGALMFTAHATEWAENPAFRVKLLLIAARSEARRVG